MRIFQAGGYEKTFDDHVRKNYGKRLLSYNYPNDIKKYFLDVKNDGTCDPSYVIIDSGAFSAWNKGVVIDNIAYTDYCRKLLKFYGQYFTEIYFVSLDVIPGNRGRAPTMEERAASALKGLANLDYMCSIIDPSHIIHVYHMYEDFSIIDKILERVNYIGVSPANDVSQKIKMKWMREVFDYIKEGTKTHGFAVTSLAAIKEFPWFSVDSATSKIATGMGKVPTPYGMIDISDKQSDSSTHIERQPEHFQSGIRQYIADKGYSYEALKTDYKLRARFSVDFFADLEKEVNDAGKNHEVKYQKAQRSIFDL